MKLISIILLLALFSCNKKENNVTPSNCSHCRVTDTYYTVHYYTNGSGYDRTFKDSSSIVSEVCGDASSFILNNTLETPAHVKECDCK